MKLVFNSIVIFDDSQQIFARDLVNNGVALIQEQQRVRAPLSKFQDRGNKYSLLTFSVSRKWATVGEAQAHLIDHPLAIVGKAIAVLTLNSGPAETLRTANDAVLTCSGSARGVTTEFSYQLRAPSFVAGEETTWTNIQGDWADQTENWETI